MVVINNTININNKVTLSEKEQTEPLYATFGRIKSMILSAKVRDEKLCLLVNKLDNDLKVAKVEENYFKNE